MNGALARISGLTALFWAVAAASSGCALVERMPERTLGEVLPAERTDWNSPLRLTRGPGAEFDGTYRAGDGSLLYASDREGSVDLFLQEEALWGLVSAARLAPHPARDYAPRFAPGGSRLAFVSTREDAGGDVWTLSLRRWLLRPAPERLTGDSTVDDHPTWHPDGRRIFYASSPSLSEPFEIWELPLGKAPVRLTDKGGTMPDCSPDGHHLAFVSSRAGGSPDLWVMRLGDGRLARLTSGPERDFQPAWSADGRRVLFARIAFDTNGDGRLGRSDAPSIHAVRFHENLFDGVGMPACRQLTSSAHADTRPRTFPGGFTFTRALGGGNTGVFALGRSGEMPRLETAAEFVEFAKGLRQRPEADPHRRLLAWQNAGWAVEEALRAGALPAGNVGRGDGARAYLEVGRSCLDLRRPKAARRTFERLVAEFPPELPAVAAAQVELLGLRRAVLESAGAGAGSSAAGEAGEKLLSAARELARSCEAEAERARVEGRASDAEALAQTAALGRVEVGRIMLACGDYADAVEAFQDVRGRFPGQPEAGAKALLGAARAYRLLDDPQALRETYLKVLTDYPEQAEAAGQAAERVAESIVRPGSPFSERLEGLRGLVEDYAGVPVLPAMAQNLIGDLYYRRGDFPRAVQEYRRTIEGFPAESTQAAAAYLAIGRIRTEQQDYDAAVEVFSQMRVRFRDRGGWLEREARRGYVNSLLRRADRAMRLGDVGLALDTYARLLDFDPSLVPAHRGRVQCYAREERLGEAILVYRPRVEGQPRDHLAHYALALAYSYYGPDGWSGDAGLAGRRARIDREALRLVERAILLDSQVAYYHQLRGFLLNRMALTRGDEQHRVRALDAYLAALGLSSPEQDPVNYANLLFNVGEGYMLVDQPEAAYAYYRRAREADFSFEGARGEAALRQMGISALAAGRYGEAIDLMQRALERTTALGRDVAALRRRAEALDRLAMAYHLDGSYGEAVARYRQYADALQELIQADPDRADGYRRNLLRAHRNLAVNLYLAFEEGQGRPDQLREAHELLREVAGDLKRVGTVRWKEAGGAGLVTIDVDVALGATGGAGEFDARAEQRLLYTYLARIEAAAGNYAEAVRYLRWKLALYPDAELERADLLTERAIVWTQVGGYELEQGRLADAARAYEQAAELERRAGNLQGEARALTSMGRLVLKMANRRQIEPERLQRAIEAHRGLLGRLGEQGASHLVVDEAALRANLGALMDHHPKGMEGEE